MAGKITANVLQLGDSATATQNFVLQTNVDGSAKLARGNAGATTQDILSIAANGLLTGAVNPTTGLRSTVLATMQKFADEFNNSLATNGWQKLPSGLIVQWGSWMSSSSVGAAVAVTFPIAFPTAALSIVTSTVAGSTSGPYAAWHETLTTTGFNGRSNTSSNLQRYIATGY